MLGQELHVRQGMPHLRPTDQNPSAQTQSLPSPFRRPARPSLPSAEHRNTIVPQFHLKIDFIQHGQINENNYTKAVTLPGGLVFQAQRLLYHSTLGLRVIKKKRRLVKIILCSKFPRSPQEASPTFHGQPRALQVMANCLSRDS